MTKYKELTDLKSIGKALENGAYKLNVTDENTYWRSEKTGQAYSCRTDYALKAIGKDYIPEGRSPASVFAEAILELRADPRKPQKRFPFDYRA